MSILHYWGYEQLLVSSPCCPHSKTQTTEGSIIWNIPDSNGRQKRELESFTAVIKYFGSHITSAPCPGELHGPI